MAEPTKPSNLSWTNLALVLLSLVLGAFANVREDSQPAPKPESWYVTIGGEVVDAPEVIAIADKLKPGQYELTGYPTAGKITRLRVVIGEDTQPGPTPQPPTPPSPPVPPSPPQPVPQTFQDKISAAATGIPVSEREAVANVYSMVSGWVENNSINSTHLAGTKLIEELGKVKTNSPKWADVWAIIRTKPAFTLDECNRLFLEIASGLRGAK